MKRSRPAVPKAARSLVMVAVLLLLAGGLSGSALKPGERSPVPAGFSAATWNWQQKLESRFLASISSSSLREHLRFLTERPHLAGTAGNLRVSHYIFDRFQEYGLRPEFREYEVLLAYPEQIRVDIVAPEKIRLAHPEPPMAADPRSDLHGDPLTTPPWCAYSADADLVAPVLYANYGRAQDYDQIRKMGLDVRGKIVLVRYFQGYRGGKSFEAQNRGVAGLLVYSDPMEDGYFQGDVFPTGPWGPMGHFQRGASVYDFLVPGDPLTPGWPSTPGARRLRPEESRILPRLPMVPLSAADALQILRRIGGQAVPKGWQGALPLTYHVGSGEERLHLLNRQRRERTRIRDVIGRIRGSEFPEEEVLLSNHHDAWVYGAVDPSSGTAAMLELAQRLGELARRGLRPRRTLVFGSWDAEEYTLTGSTEWGEEFARHLRSRAVACLNVDIAVSGKNLTVGASPLLRRVIIDSTRAVTDPENGSTLYQRWASKRVEENARGYIDRGKKESGPAIGRLGSGSDYTVFFNHLGIPSLDMYFDGPYGVYHSVYDGFVWMRDVGDPGFRYHVAMTGLWGVMALRLADADLLPLDTRAYAAALEEYLGELEAGSGESWVRRALEPVRSELRQLRQEARQWEARQVRWLQEPGRYREKLAAANRALRRLEGDLTDPEGLPGRPWFKHLIYAPLPSYRPQVLPGVAEMLARHDRPGVARQAGRLARALRRMWRRLHSLR